MSRKSQGGFTLLELLIVIVIIGILAVLVIPNLASGPIRARDSQRKSDLHNLKTALESYHHDHEGYPGVASWKIDLVPVYIKTIPIDPKTNADYSYSAQDSNADTNCVSGSCSQYTLDATLENPADKDIKSGTASTYEIVNAQ